jgi:hypothetical protein
LNEAHLFLFLLDKVPVELYRPPVAVSFEMFCKLGNALPCFFEAIASKLFFEIVFVSKWLEVIVFNLRNVEISVNLVSSVKHEQAVHQFEVSLASSRQSLCWPNRSRCVTAIDPPTLVVFTLLGHHFENGLDPSKCESAIMTIFVCEVAKEISVKCNPAKK